ncbi:helix-turn-helix transcriptional regulator [Catenulispora sp. NF23]|uniref:helix-turn-helix domain-containing protein n=1 Tax=Catenulispora pinistramenti TaxID=2705254 RepID=UPI001BAA31C6|nr:helix-turn-helix transcriptional regulator [Catenulispora pinistramenti]MBS2538198.1 helix-turn-helix transcriptional regulator [Catenulispora pinistramenti]
MTEAPRLQLIPGGNAPEPRPAAPEPLWREVLGDQLRELRRRNRESLAETASRAGISPQYLSEVERGLKEPSSEMIAAVAGALGTTLGGLAESVAGELRMRREAAVLGVRHDLASRQELASRRGLATRYRSSGPVALALAA